MGKPYLYFPVVGSIRTELLDWTGMHVTDEVLDPDGREDTLHITLAYGLPNNEREVSGFVRRVFAGGAPIKAAITYVTYFKNTGRSVLVLLCSSPRLKRVSNECAGNYKIRPSTNHHITLAYMRKGREVRTSGLAAFVGRSLEADHLVFVDQDKVHHRISL